MKSLTIFLIAFNLRFFVSLISPEFISGDSYEYYANSIELEAVDKTFYTEWYERTPVYVFFLHVTGRHLIVQMLLSALAVMLMYKINTIAGWLWCFFPEDVILSSVYLKESLLVFFIIMFLYLFRDKPKVIFIIPFAVVSVFASYSKKLIEYNAEKSQDIFHSTTAMWGSWLTGSSIMGSWSHVVYVVFILGTAILVIAAITHRNYYQLLFLTFYTITFGMAHSGKYKYYLAPVILLWAVCQHEWKLINIRYLNIRTKCIKCMRVEI